MLSYCYVLHFNAYSIPASVALRLLMILPPAGDLGAGPEHRTIASVVGLYVLRHNVQGVTVDSKLDCGGINFPI